MSIRDDVLAALRDGARTFPMIHRRVGGTRQAAMQSLILLQRAGLVERMGERRNYVYALVGQMPEDGVIGPASTGAELQAVWR